MSDLPQAITTTEQLDDLLSTPTDYVIDALSKLEGDILILGVAGKMGPTLARMAKRALVAANASPRVNVIGVARFSNPAHQNELESHGIQTIKADLLDRRQLAGLPNAPNVVYMPAMKFGSTGQEAMTWAMNTYLAGMCAERYASSKIVAFSTGNVYGLSPVAQGGSSETSELNPAGDYAMSCLGRERMFDHFSRTNGTKTALIRLNYATELRYGVLVDVAQKVWSGQPVDVSMGYFNAIWQGDANAMTLASFGHVASPPFILNVAGPELLRIKDVAETFGRLMNKPVTTTGVEANDALLSNGSLGHRLFGKPRVSIEQLMQWIASWIKQGGSNLGKPTHFEARDGKY